MKKTIIAIFLALAVGALPLMAVDLGLSLDSLSQLRGLGGEDPVGFTQSLRLNAFLSGKAGAVFAFIVSGYGDFGYSSFSAEPLSYGGNLNRLELDFFLGPAAAPSQFRVEAGRLRVSDPGAYLAFDRMDGLSAALSLGQFDMKAETGYTGLLSAKEAGIILSAQDAADYADETLFFAPPRLYAAALFKLSEVFLRGDLSLHAALQSDLRTAPTDKVDSQYLQLLLEGPIASGIAYKLGGIYQFIQTPARAARPMRTAAGATAELSWTNPAALGSRAEFVADWSSGSSEADLNAGADVVPDGLALGQTLPLGSLTAGSAFELPFQSMIRLKLAYSMSPAKALSLRLAASGFMRSGAEEPADPEFIAGSDEAWLGEEGELAIQWQPLSDLRLSLSGACFLPAADLSFAADADPRWNASLGISVDF
jgi:hypothetical protein